MKEQYDAKYRLDTLAHIAKLWAKSPSLRLGQLLMNLTRKDWDTDSQAQGRLWNEENWESYELKPVQKWRVPTDEDAKKRPKCRYRESTSEDWEYGKLIHVRKLMDNKNGAFYVLMCNGFTQPCQLCQVLDESEPQTIRQVVCIEQHFAELTEGQIYSVLDVDGDGDYYIKGNKGEKHYYNKDRFKDYDGEPVEDKNEPQTLQQRIEEQFEGKRVEVLNRDNRGSLIVINKHAHTQAPSLKGFAGFVYTRGRTGQRLAHNAAPVNKVDGKYQFPVAILFEADK